MLRGCGWKCQTESSRRETTLGLIPLSTGVGEFMRINQTRFTERGWVHVWLVAGAEVRGEL